MKKIKIYNLAVRNLRRKYIRTVVLLLIVAVVTGTLLSATIFISGMKNALRRTGWAFSGAISERGSSTKALVCIKG